MSKFIVFEGPDGVGKTSQMELLKNHLESQGKDVVMIENVSNEDTGLTIRKLLKGEGEIVCRPQIVSLYMADLHYTDVQVQKLLNEGKTVICSRWTSSTITYGTGMAFKDLNFLATGYAAIVSSPDIVIDLKLDIETAFERISNREGDGEYFDKCPEKFKSIFENYEILRKELANVVNYNVVDSSGSINEVSETINEIVDNFKGHKISQVENAYGMSVVYDMSISGLMKRIIF